MLEEVFAKLDDWIAEENHGARDQGLKTIPRCEFKIVGQTALLEARLNLQFAATVEVDIFHNAHHEVISKLNELLYVKGLQFDQLSNEIWMPKESRYVDFYKGIWLAAVRAEPEFVMLSKAKMAPGKNKILLRSYLASQPTQEFFDLCQHYQVDLLPFIE